ncbi:hypothetical protein CRE_00337 [Caenorhabditis remanei]|uniref:Uncharacterized protein n=1 Tax=Caenorhabditis remanei TaxID=31234 RepID=E3LEK8_CAERE|nr:hypothetical protein CRE_00337 [Caenorhabditis remanei]
MSDHWNEQKQYLLIEKVPNLLDLCLKPASKRLIQGTYPAGITHENDKKISNLIFRQICINNETINDKRAKTINETLDITAITLDSWMVHKDFMKGVIFHQLKTLRLKLLFQMNCFQSPSPTCTENRMYYVDIIGTLKKLIGKDHSDKLNNLCIEGKHVKFDESWIKNMSNTFPKLESLDLTGCDLNNSQFKELAKMYENMKELSLAKTEITSINEIYRMKNLEILNLSGVEFRNSEQMQGLFELKQLRVLDISCYVEEYVSNVEFYCESRKHLPELEHIVCCGNEVTTEQVLWLDQNHKNLRVIDLVDTELDCDDSIQEMKTNAQLMTVHTLENCIQVMKKCYNPFRSQQVRRSMMRIRELLISEVDEHPRKMYWICFQWIQNIFMHNESCDNLIEVAIECIYQSRRLLEIMSARDFNIIIEIFSVLLKKQEYVDGGYQYPVYCGSIWTTLSELFFQNHATTKNKNRVCDLCIEYILAAEEVNDISLYQCVLTFELWLPSLGHPRSGVFKHLVSLVASFDVDDLEHPYHIIDIVKRCLSNLCKNKFAISDEEETIQLATKLLEIFEELEEEEDRNARTDVVRCLQLLVKVAVPGPLCILFEKQNLEIIMKPFILNDEDEEMKKSFLTVLILAYCRSIRKAVIPRFSSSILKKFLRLTAAFDWTRTDACMSVWSFIKTTGYGSITQMAAWILKQIEDMELIETLETGGIESCEPCFQRFQSPFKPFLLKMSFVKLIYWLPRQPDSEYVRGYIRQYYETILRLLNNNKATIDMIKYAKKIIECTARFKNLFSEQIKVLLVDIGLSALNSNTWKVANKENSNFVKNDVIWTALMDHDITKGASLETTNGLVKICVKSILKLDKPHITFLDLCLRFLTQSLPVLESIPFDEELMTFLVEGVSTEDFKTDEVRYFYALEILKKIYSTHQNIQNKIMDSRLNRTLIQDLNRFRRSNKSMNKLLDYLTFFANYVKWRIYFEKANYNVFEDFLVSTSPKRRLFKSKIFGVFWILYYRSAKTPVDDMDEQQKTNYEEALFEFLELTKTSERSKAKSRNSIWKELQTSGSAPIQKLARWMLKNLK